MMLHYDPHPWISLKRAGCEWWIIYKCGEKDLDYRPVFVVGDSFFAFEHDELDVRIA